MHALAAMASAAGAVDLDTFPAPGSPTSSSFIMMGFLIPFGWGSSHHTRVCTGTITAHGSSGSGFTKDKGVIRQFTARDDQRSLHLDLHLPDAVRSAWARVARARHGHLKTS